MAEQFEHPIAATLVEVLQAHALAIGNKQAFRFVRSLGTDEDSVSYRALHERALAIAGELQTLTEPGERALLLFPPGLEFIAAFFGCLYAGVVAVPVAIPPRRHSTSPIEAIIESCRPALVLSTADYCDRAARSYGHLPTLLARPWFATDQVDGWRRTARRLPRIEAHQTAFLQYTSGSTSMPRGVVVTHENLLRNAAFLQRALGATSKTQGVIWLPQYHDMGLIGGMLQPIYQGSPCTLLAPAAFLQRPALWLETIEREQARASGGPDFAYELCVSKISQQDRARMDLSSWTLAFTGAERVRADTLERFVEAFAPCGFRRESFFPCYGLAEATLFVSGGPPQTEPTVIRVQAEALTRNRVEEALPDDADGVTLVGCGQCLPGQTVAIVDPQTRRPCPAGEVGEIWIQGPSVANGYYREPEATAAVFGGYLESGEGPYLRSGDLGFFRDGQLFITGRLKDVIIIRGRNHYPEDIEHSVGCALAAMRGGTCAAFSIEVAGSERLVVVQEVEPRGTEFERDAALTAIRRVVAAEHHIEVYAAVLTKLRQVPKTSSGKKQRSACRQRYLSGGLDVVAQWRANIVLAADIPSAIEIPIRPQTVSASEAERWLIDRISSRLGIPARQVGPTSSFLDLGIGSVDAVEIAADLEFWLGHKISPTAIYNYPNIAALAQWLVGASHHGERPADLHGQPASDEPDSGAILDDVRSMSEADMRTFVEHEMTKL